MQANTATSALHSALVIDIVPETQFPHLRYTSGLFVYDEVFVAGRLLGRWWASDGGIRPEMHYRWSKWFSDTAPHLPAEAFRLGINGETLDHDWQWLAATEEADSSGFRGDGRPVRHAVIRLHHTRQPVDVAVHTRIDGSPFMLRWLEITNTGERPLALSALAPWNGLIWNHRADEHIPPGAPSPFEVAYNHQVHWGEEGDFWWEPLQEGVKTFDGGRQGRSGWSRPAFVLRNRANGEILWAELGWSGNWRMDLHCRKQERGTRKLEPPWTSLTFALGPDSADQALRVIDPDEVVRTPVLHLGLFHSDLDTCAQAAHTHVREVIMPPQLLDRHQRIEANHRGYICDRESEAGIKHEIDIAAEVGTEMFVVDAGWYGPEPNVWADNVGDWYAGSWLPAGLEPVVAHAHERGMLFGLWVEIESIGRAAQLRQAHADWVMTRNEQPVAGGRALDLAHPAVMRWMEDEIIRIIERYNLDMFRLDYNTTVFEGGNRSYGGFIENTLWRHCEALYSIFDHVRARFPNVIFENCAGGGGRLDWEILRRFQITEVSDWMRAPRGIKILYGLTYALPPEICLRTFGTETGEHMLEGDLDTQLRHVIMSHPIFRGIAPSLAELNPHYRARILHAVDLYKQHIRPLLQGCRVVHHTGPLPIFDPTPWCVLEYAAPDRLRCVIALFRLAEVGDESYIVRPCGLDLGRDYLVSFDNRAEMRRYRGSELAEHGIRIRLPATLSSELLLLEVVA
ncbi:MAG: alpha-galactosidase [Herpetosiphonaceae bacterium]|nr:alpha-galactosidase [Herpetosiphonaceae bacterium]